MNTKHYVSYTKHRICIYIYICTTYILHIYKKYAYLLYNITHIGIDETGITINI